MRIEINPSEVDQLRSVYQKSQRASDVLRAIMQRHPSIGPIDLMKYVATVFNLEHDDVSCVNGWWVDGSGELDDGAIGRLLGPSIERERPTWDRGSA